MPEKLLWRWNRTFRLGPATYLLLATVFGALVGCHPTATKRTHAPPQLDSLKQLMYLAAKPGSSVSGVAGLDSCRILVADRVGRLTLLTGDTLKVIGTVPGARSLVLDATDPNHLTARSDTPPFLARVGLFPFTLDSFSVPRSPWGPQWVGPTANVGPFLAMASIGNPEKYRPSHSATESVPLITLLDSNGVVRGALGPTVQPSPGYLTWVHNRSQIGQLGETLLVVNLESATLSHYVRAADSAHFTLPGYFEPVRPSEDILRLPWIQYGELPLIYNAPSMLEAAFSPSGKLYAVRPYSYRWLSRPNRYAPSAGLWQVEAEALEVYSPRGEFLGAYRLPGDPRTIRVDNLGRLFIVYRDTVGVFQDPFAPAATCQFKNRDL